MGYGSKVCEYCGAQLDPGERCDCKEAVALRRALDGKKAFGKGHKRDAHVRIAVAEGGKRHG